MNQAVIGVGSNIEPELNLPRARERIAERHVIVAESPLVETSPVGYLRQPISPTAPCCWRPGSTAGV